MASTIIMPQLGETVAEGKILAWFKSVGDEIKEGDNLFEVETDKVTIEVQAIVAGRLSEIRVGSGVDGQGRRSASRSSAMGRRRRRPGPKRPSSGRLRPGARPLRRSRRQPTSSGPPRGRTAYASRRSPAG